MQYNLLGKTGLVVSRLALGTVSFGNLGSKAEASVGSIDKTQAKALLDYALDQGVNFLNTTRILCTHQ